MASKQPHTPPSLLHKAIAHIDHVTYVADPSHEARFLKEWKLFGFKEIQRLHTPRFPATHIALTCGHAEGFPWGTMTGLSVSEDPHSPINEFVSRYGEGAQHAAYNINPKVDLELLQKEMKQSGWNFMTSVLTYKDGHGARLRQMFSVPVGPFGNFTEFVQRLEGPHGEVYDGFDTENIDDLYECYTDYSHWLENHPKKIQMAVLVKTPKVGLKHRVIENAGC